jgi:hypothetical protein
MRFKLLFTPNIRRQIQVLRVYCFLSYAEALCRTFQLPHLDYMLAHRIGTPRLRHWLRFHIGFAPPGQK